MYINDDAYCQWHSAFRTWHRVFSNIPHVSVAPKGADEGKLPLRHGKFGILRRTRKRYRRCWRTFDF